MNGVFSWIPDALKSMVVAAVPDLAEEDRIYWKNWTFTPDPTKPWIKPVFIPAEEYGVTLGDNGDNETNGFFQINIYSPINIGDELSQELCRRLNAAFKIPQRIPAPEGCMLRLTNKGFSTGGQTSVNDFGKGGADDNWDVNFITVYWLAREPR